MDAFASIHPVPAAWLRNSDLAPFIPAYWRGLIDQQYAANTVRGYLYGVAHFARWARRSRLAVGDVTAENVERFLDGHLAGCTCPQPVQRSRHQLRAALRLLLSSLDHAGVVVQPRIPDPVQEELHRFDDHMHHARGLAQSCASIVCGCSHLSFSNLANPMLAYCHCPHRNTCASSSSSGWGEWAPPVPGPWPARCAHIYASEQPMGCRWATCCRSLRHPRTGDWLRYHRHCPSPRLPGCSARSRANCHRRAVLTPWSAALSIWVCEPVKL